MNNFTTRTVIALLLCGTLYLLTGCSSAKKTSANSNRTINEAAPTATKTPTAPPENNAVPKQPPPAAKETENVSAKSGKASISKANYEKIKEGMSRAEVEQLLGGEGLQVATNKINGRETEIFKWTEDNFESYIDVTFEKNKVVEKKEKNLK